MFTITLNVTIVGLFEQAQSKLIEYSFLRAGYIEINVEGFHPKQKNSPCITKI